MKASIRNSIFFSLFLLLCVSSIVQASVIELKSGEKVTVTIIELAENYVYVEEAGMYKTYFASEIKMIDNAIIDGKINFVSERGVDEVVPADEAITIAEVLEIKEEEEKKQKEVVTEDRSSAFDKNMLPQSCSSHDDCTNYCEGCEREKEFCSFGQCKECPKKASRVRYCKEGYSCVNEKCLKEEMGDSLSEKVKSENE